MAQRENLREEIEVPQVFRDSVPVEEKKVDAEGAEAAYNLERKRSGLPPLKVDAPTAGPEYSACFYKRSNSIYGNKKPEVLSGGRHGLSNRFSQNLGAAGMWRNAGLNTSTDHARFMDNTTDWMLRLE
mmetsp:Transcript_4608/g.11283  ORF Transcript_4608/g.11283 Transcript_4608/m.11283 type:complete len:128 (+) Transcript_4608:202-585(+)|eukprot:CAMPEP_0179010176 /NCGR_PEP_ID=MMETSP0795-20121207/16662_1 /TAXON_ID=88552 /ORGANISM="Amoebophrya sp., Strain Ameob2" /LENGTH=127 /DNA_ID=CAMNT_0020705415 /DNA_START=132 /DNA_END=515 /DNA_ORIENTATION=-